MAYSTMMLQSAAKESSKHNIRVRTRQNTNRSTVVSNSVPNALKSSLDCIAKKIHSLNGAEIHSSATDISWVRVLGDDRRRKIPEVISGRLKLFVQLQRY